MEKLTKEPPPTHVVIPFKKGDKVTTFDVKGKPVRGTVAWIGKNKEAMPNGSYIIGVYTVRCTCSVCVFSHVFIDVHKIYHLHSKSKAMQLKVQFLI